MRQIDSRSVEIVPVAISVASIGTDRSGRREVNEGISQFPRNAV